MITTSILLFVLSNVLAAYNQRAIIKANWNYTPRFKQLFFIGLVIGYSFWIGLFYMQCYTIVAIAATISILLESIKLVLKTRYER